MSDHKLSYQNIGKILDCIRLVRGDGYVFRVSDYERIHKALLPEDSERLEVQPGHTLHQTVGGRLFDYWSSKNGKYGPVIDRLEPEPDPQYKIISEGQNLLRGRDV